MVDYYEVVGISLQTFAGLIFIIDQVSPHDKTKVFNHISAWFSWISVRASSPKRPQRSLVIFAFVVLTILFLLLMLLTSPYSNENIVIAVFGALMVATFSYGLYSATIESILSLFFKSERRFVFRLTSSKKEGLKIVTEKRYFWNVDLESERYKNKFNLANLIIFLVCSIEYYLAVLIFRSNLLSNHNLFLIILDFIFVLGLLAIFVVLIPTFLYLLGLSFLYFTKLLLKIWWIFLVTTWLSGGILLIIGILNR